MVKTGVHMAPERLVSCLICLSRVLFVSKYFWHKIYKVYCLKHTKVCVNFFDNILSRFWAPFREQIAYTFYFYKQPV